MHKQVEMVLGLRVVLAPVVDGGWAVVRVRAARYRWLIVFVRCNLSATLAAHTRVVGLSVDVPVVTRFLEFSLKVGRFRFLLTRVAQ